MNEVREEKRVDAIKEAERAWHDSVYNAHALDPLPGTAEGFQEMFRKGQLTPFCEGGWSWWSDLRLEALESVGEVRGLHVLDYGCGSGRLGIYLGLCGAQVWGFDLSRPAIETANRNAQRYGLPTQFEQMDAEELAFPDDSFDLVIGFGVLHHVIKYPRAGSHLFRIMKPGARAVFHETLWDNPIINLARRFTSVDSQAGDAHLTERNIREFGRQFGLVGLEKRHLFYMLKRLAKLPPAEWNTNLKPRPLWRLVKALDKQILRFPPLRRYCGEVIVFLQK
jgi:2-polyprenyl-3-methyl-5-hydroxy-6-metoxy-1,4-benzoquinol methylase